MASLRRVFLVRMRDVLRTLGADWDVQISGRAHKATAKVRVEVMHTNEEKEPSATEAYACDVFFAITIGVNNADASAAELPDGDEGNPDLYCERMVTLVEAKLHEDGVWGSAPPFTRPIIDLLGWDYFDPPDRSLSANRTFAIVAVKARFEHLRTDPSVEV